MQILIRNYSILKLFQQNKSKPINNECHLLGRHSKILFKRKKNESILSSRQTKKVEGDDEEKTEEQDEEIMTKIMSSQMYLTPLDVLKHLEKIWMNEKQVLADYLATLRSAIHSLTDVHNDPISLFFFEVLPVLPSKFRPVCFFLRI